MYSNLFRVIVLPSFSISVFSFRQLHLMSLITASGSGGIAIIKSVHFFSLLFQQTLPCEDIIAFAVMLFVQFMHRKWAQKIPNGTEFLLGVKRSDVDWFFLKRTHLKFDILYLVQQLETQTPHFSEKCPCTAFATTWSGKCRQYPRI